MSVAEVIGDRTARSVRVILRDWIKERIDGEDVITVETLVSDAYRELSHDEEFAEAMIADGLAIMIPTIAREVWHHGREFLSTETGAVSRESLDQKSSRFSRWVEHVGEGRHKVLLACMSDEKPPSDMRNIVYGTKPSDVVEDLLQWALREFEEARRKHRQNVSESHENLESMKSHIVDLVLEGDRLTDEIARLVKAIDEHRRLQ